VGHAGLSETTWPAGSCDLRDAMSSPVRAWLTPQRAFVCTRSVSFLCVHVHVHVDVRVHVHALQGPGGYDTLSSTTIFQAGTRVQVSSFGRARRPANGKKGVLPCHAMPCNKGAAVCAASGGGGGGGGGRRVTVGFVLLYSGEEGDAGTRSV